MIPFFSWRNARECLLGGIGIYTLCMIGQQFYKVADTLAAPLWPSSGLALALLLLRGWRLFPAITFGTIAATGTFGNDPLFMLAGSLGNTLESLTGWFLMTRVFDFSIRMERVRDMLLLLLAGSPFGTLLSGLICTAGLVETGSVTFSEIPLSMLLFWTGNVLGIIIFTPAVLLLATRRSFPDSGPILGKLPYLLLPLLTVLVGFRGTLFTSAQSYPLAFLPFPAILWLAFSAGLPLTSLAVALVTTVATGFTMMGYGPFVHTHPMETYGQLTIYIVMLSSVSLVIAALEQERKRNSIRRNLALSGGGLAQWGWDSLNGLDILDLHLPGELGLDNSTPISSSRLLSLVDPDDHSLLPWVAITEGMNVGDHTSAEIRLRGEGSNIILLTAQIRKIDQKGRPLEMLGVLRNITHEKKATELRVIAAKRETELRSIRSQLNPHFLFNSLNVLKSLIAEDSAKAQQAVVSLAGLLRASLRATKRNLIPLHEEVRVIGDFLALQKMRFEGRLTFDIRIAPSTENLMVPPMLFQQLAENAVKHGIDPLPEGGEIIIESRLEGEILILRVSNPGVVGDSPEKGFGVLSIHEQLESLYGSKASFVIGNEAINPHEKSRVVSEVRIPLE